MSIFDKNPIYTLILCILICSIAIKQSLLKGEVLKYRLTISFFFIFIVSAMLFFYNDIKKEEIVYKISTYILLFIDVVCFICIYQSLSVSVTQRNFNKQVSSYLDETKLYCLVDNKDRVIEISGIFAGVFGIDKESVNKSKYLDLIDQFCDIEVFNGEETNNNLVRSYYRNYINTVSVQSKIKSEIVLQKKNGDKVVLNVIEKPIFVGSKYKGRFIVGDIVSHDSLLNIEKELSTKHLELESIKYKFISALEITPEAIFFKNLDSSSIWGNDNLVNLLKLPKNSLPVNEYYKCIYQDDLVHYNQVLSSLTPSEPTYDITYRFNFGSNYQFVREIGKRIFENEDANEIIGFVSILKSKHFERSNIEELDNLLTQDDLLAKTTKLYEEDKMFELVTFKLDNIPGINEQFGRDIGNMYMGKYISMIQNNLLSSQQDIFRISGLEFAFVLVDARKMEKLKNVLVNEEKILHVKSDLGSINVTIEVFMGKAYSSDVKDAKSLIAASLKALKFAQKEQFKANYASYKDVI